MPRTLRFTFLAALLAAAFAPAQDLPYTVAPTPWPELLGSARARIRVEQAAPAVRSHLPWRRHDPHPEAKAVIVTTAAGAEVRNAFTARADAASGDIVFSPDAGPGDYYAYYLALQEPPKGRLSPTSERKAAYRAPAFAGDPAWKQSAGNWNALPHARALEFQARTAFDSFSPMEVTATAAEMRQLARAHPQPYLVFVEDRQYPIRMFDALPARWIASGPVSKLDARALRGEFYVFQVGVYAQPGASTQAAVIEPSFDSLTAPSGAKIDAAAFTCFNTEGRDAAGRPFRKEWSVAPGRVGALWCGVQVPLNAAPGAYTGKLTLTPRGGAPLPVDLRLQVGRDFLRNGGVDQPERLARIQWLNSAIGTEETVTAPYTPLRVDGATVDCLGRQVRFGPQGLPVSIRANGTELLAGPVAFQVHGPSGAAAFRGAVRPVSASAAKAVFDADSSNGAFRLAIRSTMEFDGGIGVQVELTPTRDAELSDLTLDIPLRPEAVPYTSGMGMNGGKRPARWEWHWKDQPQRWADQGSNLEHFLWLGGLRQGLYCRLKSPLNHWRNGAQGGVRFEESGGRVLYRAFTGPLSAKAGQVLALSFRLMPTPVKPLDPGHWKYRYAHTYRPLEEIQATGATVVNIHHDTLPNLWINYPFLNLDLLVPYVREAHARGLKAKVYYTIRELTSRLPELWAFRSLGDEIYRTGGTQAHGATTLDWWLQEHIVSDYSPAWITRTPIGEVDAALRTRPVSRLNNFYLEGLKWLLDNVQIDGLYLDEVAYPREIMQRVRRVLDSRPGSMIDLHGNRQWWSCNSPAAYYLEHLPYVDRVWFGEAFNPDSPPDFWLVEMSGLPFGLSGDMLQNPNPWRGMVFGMTTRAFYSGASPTPIWKLWSDFGIEQAEMLGWWDAACPVKTGRDDVVATVYRRPGKALVSIASWAPETTAVKLAIDWKALGLDPARARLRAPAIEGFQPAQSFTMDAVEVAPKKGWLIVIE